MASVKKDVALSIGPVQALVSIENAVSEDREVSLKNVCTGLPGHEHAPVNPKQELKCPSCNNVDKSTFRKGKEVGSAIVIIPPEEITKMGASDEFKKGITLSVHPAEQLEGMVPGGKFYYLSPGLHAKPFNLIAKMVRDNPQYAFVGQFAVRTVTSMYRVIPRGTTLALQSLAWPEQVKAMPAVPTTDLLDKEVNLMSALLEAGVEDFDIATYRDTRAESMATFLATAEGVEAGVVVDLTDKSSKSGIDLTSLLETALAAKGKPKKATAKKAARKTPAKKVG